MSAQLRIAIDACPLVERRTGVGNYVHELLLELCNRHQEAQFYLYSNSRIHFPALPNVTLRPESGTWRGVLWQNFQLPRQMKKDRVSVYWGTNGFVPILGLGRLPSVVTIHDLSDRFTPHAHTSLVLWSRRFAQPRSARVANSVLCVSDATAADVAKIYGVNSKATVHPIAQARFHHQSTAEIQRIRQKYHLNGEFLLTVGTLEPRKNINHLVEVFCELKREGLSLPLLAHVGGSGWLNDGIEETLQKGEREGVVKRLGFVPVDDLPGLYSACTAFIMPSLYEGFGMPVLEAQLCGAPVLHGNHASMIEAGGNLGITFEPTTAGIAKVLRDFHAGQSALVCRMPNDIINDPNIGADIIWQALVEASGLEI